MSNTLLSDIFQIRGRFRRSVHLERDFYTESVLDGYVLTVSARDMLGRVVSTFENERGSKAWSLTGPYGSGKSAFALFAAQLLGARDTSAARQALEILKAGDAELHARFVSVGANGKGAVSSSGFCPVLISGERAPLTRSLLRGLQHGLSRSNGDWGAAAVLDNLKEMVANGGSPSASEITALFESATRQICDAGGSGLLVVVDELGKFLEYAADRPAQADIFVLQSLAELADRSTPAPFFLMTILHQAFEFYVERASRSQREEWAKVQGRFEDVVFTEPTEQVLRLISAALVRHPEVVVPPNLNNAIALGLKPRQLNEDEFILLLKSCLPLHPTVALMIGPLFRRFSQNERSLFAFLSSSEPHGLQDFLASESYDGEVLPLFSLAELYDYLHTTQGHRLYASHNGKKWVEIESALDCLSDPSPLALRLIKTIGLLNVVNTGIPELKASAQMLRYALDANGGGFEEALADLKRRSIVIYRRYNDTYALWEGSDIDIEVRLREAAAHIGSELVLAADLSRYTQPRPLVARQHLFETGTLRHFTVRYTNLENFEADLSEPFEDADGLILYTLPATQEQVDQFIEKACGMDSVAHAAVLVAIPRSIESLQEVVFELACLHWVAENTPELEGDAVARRELLLRQMEAERAVSGQLTEIFKGDKDRDKTCLWYHKGKPVESINSQRARNRYLSEICKQVYPGTPIIRNELINRRSISATAATARRKLIEAMLERSDMENLGINGYPAEMSIYRSVLESTGMHRKVSDMWGFCPPTEESLMPVWGEIDAFLEECEGERQPVVALYKCLEAEPYGVRNGLLPILLCAALLHYKSEIALYENGGFAPEWSVPLFERLLKMPQRFEIKRFRMTAIRGELFEQFLKVLRQSSEPGEPDLLTVVAPLMQFIAQLPDYTLKTEELSDEAKRLRTSVTNAREPDELLFGELPKALGFPVFSPEIVDSQVVSDFCSRLQEVLSELRQVYESLLNSIEQRLKTTFALEDEKELQRVLVRRAEPLLEITVGGRLNGFLRRVCDGKLRNRTDWLEAVALYVANKPPRSWNDEDNALFEMNLSTLARQFHHFEAVSYEEQACRQPSSSEPVRVGITRPHQAEQERVVTLPSAADKQASEIEKAIDEVFKQFGMGTDTLELRVAIFARIAQKWMQQLQE